MTTRYDAPLAAVFLALGNATGDNGKFGLRSGNPVWETAAGNALPISLRITERTVPANLGHDLFYSIASNFMQDEAGEAALLSEYEGWAAYCRGLTRLAMMQTWPWLAPLFALIDEVMPRSEAA